jgi:hypothetical protein
MYCHWFRKLARLAGIPDEIWNMDLRAGAITESYEAGVDLPEAMSLATHTTPSISRRYNRSNLKASSRAAEKRVASRTQPE